MFRKILCTLFIFIVFIIFPKSSLAANEFSTAYDVFYDVGNDGITNVSEKTTLTNLTGTYYASSFTMTIGSTTLTDVSATDDGGKMETIVTNKDNQTIINVKFNQQITGVDKKQVFTLSYKSKDFAQKIGKTWEVNLPRIHSGSDINSFNVSLSVPISFGEPTSITPKPKTEFDKSGKIFFTFDKDQLTNSGVSVNFGTNQIFDFNLKYDLDNTSFLPVVTSIALPPDTNYQDTSITDINPKPLNVTIDSDGNYLAWYQIPKRTKQQIEVTGLVKLYITPKKNDSLILSASQIKELTKTDQYWEKDNPAISNTLKEIFKNGEPKTTEEKARLIYQYVVNTLKYNSTRLDNLQRLGAVTALNNTDKAVCMEFTDLFIALARRAGIPSRELDGYAYTENTKLRPLSFNSDLLHAWPEYFNEKTGWVMVDPTWENTSGGVDYFNKFDLNHIVLDIKGKSSTEPNPPDGVKIEIREVEFKPILKPNIEIAVNNPLWAGFPAEAKIRITNQGSGVLKTAPLQVSSSKINLLNAQNITVPKIPPFGFAEYKINLRTPFSWQSTNDNIVADYSGKEFSKQITIKPVFQFFPVPYAVFGLIGLLVIGYLSILGFHYLQNRNKS